MLYRMVVLHRVLGMAYLTKHPQSKYWIAAFRDITGKRMNRSTRIERNPPGKDAKKRAQLASENRRLAQAVADEFEQTGRAARTESQIRKTLGDLYCRVNSGREIEFATCRAYLTKWLTNVTALKAEGTAARYSGTVKTFLESLGEKADIHLGDITAADIDNFTAKRLEKGRNPTTVQTDLKTLNTPFALARKQGLILSNPVAAASPLDAEKEAREPFAQDEIAALLRAAEGDWKTIILLGAFAGLRLQDAVNLRWSNLDLDDGYIELLPKKTARKNRKLKIPLHPSIEKHLKSLNRPKSGEDAFISPSLAGKTPGGYNGLSMRFNAIRESAKIAQDSIAAKGTNGRAFNRKTFHSLRHFYITALETAGVDEALRKKLAGHSDSKSHARYTHTEFSTLKTAIKKIS